MTEKRRQFDNEPDLTVSGKFSEDLGKLFAPGQSIPSDIDRAVAEAARRHLARPQRRLWWLRWTVPATAAAAIALACLWWAYYSTAPATAPTALSQLAEERASIEGRAEAGVAQTDVDGNGRINILDAFTLARHIETEQPVDKTWDFNGDGLIDRRDVDTVAMAAVRLNKGV